MRSRFFILSIIFTLFISWLPVQSSQAARCDNLGIANDFNVFVFGNHTQMSSDSEGRVAVGKRAEYTNYGIGDKLTPSAAGRNDLIVGEELYAEGGTNFNGNTVIGVNGTIEKYTMTNNNGQKEPLREDVSGLFADAKADLINKTSKWSQLTPNGTFENQYSTLTLKGDHPELNIFTLKTEDFQGVSLFKLIVPEDATVLINVLGTDLRLSGFALKKGDQDFSPSDGGRILWNFPELINFDLSNIGMVGSILAPYATLAPTGSGQLNGTLIVENFIHSQHGGIETHHYPFNAKLPMEDEEDEPIKDPKGSIQFTKVEKGTNKKLEGAIFRLYVDKECTKEADHADVQSSEDGIVTFKELSYGTYYVKEIKAPMGYQLSSEIREVTVDKKVVDAGTFDNEYDSIIIEEPKGSIQFTKVEKGTDKQLEGATFRLYMDKECTKEADHADVQSSEDGIVTFKELSYGTYYVKEIAAPEGYQLSTEIREVIVDKDDTEVDAGTFENELIFEDPKGSIQFTKVEKGTDKKLEGATFRLYMDKECTKEAGHADVQSDKDGIVSFTDLSYGTYYVKEVTAPKGYELSTEIREVTVDKEVVHAGTFDNELIIVEEPKGSIQFTKVEKGTNKKLEGAIFRLYMDKECTKEADHADVQSDKDGMVSFTELSYGTYYVKEVAAPEGYQLSTEVREVTVDKEVVDAGTFDNELIIVEEPKGSIQFTKIEKGTGKQLEGATFRLYMDKECTKEAGHADVKSNEDGIVSFTDLPYGTYYVKEVAAPEGYQLSTEVREVTVDKEVVDAGTFENELIIIEEPKGSIQFTKIEKGTGKQLEGATFRLYMDKECTKEAGHADVKSDKNGIVSFTELSYGTY
ncbi:SpaA isopeptide-forming pilin-related protein, partial [Pradoshia sp.]|uniref:SpaA isopeptide-forming pilin-related protein n=1 Tax=Pradoshia sp. TaxID=2651281 RepID=UPI003F0906D0